MFGMINVKFKKLKDTATVPKYATEGSSGADLYAIEDTWMYAGMTAIVSTGVSIQLPKGYEAQVRSRSGLAANHGISVLNSPGTIDQDYTGEIKVILTKKAFTETYQIKAGERIAQLIIAPYVQASFVQTDEFEETIRGDNGFGSTGTK
jgi:dUTP pyrophosphatase